MPPNRIPPGPGQESVWDYPRPPRLERVADRVRILFAGAVLADTTAAWRVLETSHPPTYYLPRADIAPGALVPAGGGSVCEWKGPAAYVDVVLGGRRAERVGWTYPDPCRPSRPSPTIMPSTRARWTPVSSATSGRPRNPVASTGVG